MARSLTTHDVAVIADVRRMIQWGEVRQARVNARLSIREMAAACGVSPSTVLAWESGAVPRSAAALRLAAVLSELEGNHP